MTRDLLVFYNMDLDFKLCKGSDCFLHRPDSAQIHTQVL